MEKIYGEMAQLLPPSNISKSTERAIAHITMV